MYPTNLRYTNQHEWISVDRETARVGITDFAQHELGDIVYVELPETGKELRAGEILGTVESVKAVAEIYAPASGTVTEVNRSLMETPEILNRDPHGEGWICKMRLRDPGELSALMEAAVYERFIAG